MSILNMNGGAVVAMAGKDCVAIASDMRFGQQFQTIGMNCPKVHEISDKVVFTSPIQYHYTCSLTSFHTLVPFHPNWIEVVSDRRNLICVMTCIM